MAELLDGGVSVEKLLHLISLRLEGKRNAKDRSADQTGSLACRMGIGIRVSRNAARGLSFHGINSTKI
jgi:hypothetical protein